MQTQKKMASLEENISLGHFLIGNHTAKYKLEGRIKNFIKSSLYDSLLKNCNRVLLTSNLWLF